MNPDLVKRFLADQKIDTMFNVDQPTISEFVMRQRSYDPAKFIAQVDMNADWASVIVAHIHLDHVMDKFLSEFCVVPAVFQKEHRRMALLDKATFAYGVGILSKGSVSNIRKLNKMRNQFAHKLSFSVSDDLVKELRSTMVSCYGERIREREEFRKAKDGKVVLKDLLKLSVVFVEEERLGYLISVLRNARSQADLTDALEIAQAQLNRSSNL